jgi:hypothetical protein
MAVASVGLVAPGGRADLQRVRGAHHGTDVLEVEAIAAQEVRHCLGFVVAVEVEALAAEEVGHCLGFEVEAEVEAIAAEEVRHCLGFEVEAEVEAIAANGVRPPLPRVRGGSKSRQ